MVSAFQSYFSDTSLYSGSDLFQYVRLFISIDLEIGCVMPESSL